MATIRCFEDLNIWQDARVLSKEIYSITQQIASAKDYRFAGQIRAAAGSIMDNIAEGFERDRRKEFIQFLYIAKGSCGEVRSQLARAFDVGYISEEIYQEYRTKCLNESAAIANFIGYLKKAEIAGLKSKPTEEK